MSNIKILNKGGLSWNIFLRIKDAALDMRGVVFGGAVRDLIIHNHAASSFYDKVGKGLYNDSDYNDFYVDPETRDRFILPQDIDVVFYSKTDLRKFKETLARSGFVIINESTPHSPSYYFANFPEGWLHSKWVVTIKLHELLVNHTRTADIPTYEVDVIFPDPTTSVVVNHNMLPPFGVADFECNALAIVKVHGQEMFTIDNKFLSVLGSSGLSRQVTIERITKDIIAKKAIFIGCDGMENRIRKMIYRNYAIQTDIINVSYSPQELPSFPPPMVVKSEDDTKADVCLICFDEVKSDYVGLKCCKGKYHPKCLKQVIEIFDTCPQCRSNYYAGARDKHFLSSLIGTFDYMASVQPMPTIKAATLVFAEMSLINGAVDAS